MKTAKTKTAVIAPYSAIGCDERFHMTVPPGRRLATHVPWARGLRSLGVGTAPECSLRAPFACHRNRSVRAVYSAVVVLRSHAFARRERGAIDAPLYPFLA